MKDGEEARVTREPTRHSHTDVLNISPEGNWESGLYRSHNQIVFVVNFFFFFNTIFRFGRLMLNAE